MPDWLKSVFSWGDFFTLALALIVLYFLLTFAQRMLPKLGFSDRIGLPMQKGIDYLLLVYEPLVLLLLSSAFVLLNPLFHGLLMALFLLVGFSHVKNYISGRLLQLDRTVSVGQQLRMRDIQGMIAEKGRLGLRLRSNKGLHFIAYSKLLNEGYLLLSGEEIGGFYLLSISPRKEEEKVDHVKILSDLLTTTPYLDWLHTPELRNSTDPNYPYQVRISVREENHLRDLIVLIEQEWDYACKISKNKN